MAESIKYINKVLDKGRQIRESHQQDESIKEVEPSEENSRRESIDNIAA